MRVILSQSAADYLRKEAFYLKGKNPGAAAAFSQRIRDALMKLEVFPDLGSQGLALPIPGSRTLVAGDYLLDYTQDGHTVTVISIRHARMRPPGAFPVSDDETDFDT